MPRVNSPWKMTWAKALENNPRLDKADHLLWGHLFSAKIATTEDGKIGLTNTRTAILPAETKQRITRLANFVAEQQALRQGEGENGEAEAGWQKAAEIRSDDAEHYKPRDINPMFKFASTHSNSFSGLRVLDIGCRVGASEEPQYEHYRKMGAGAIGLDLNIENDPVKGTYQGDVRMLPDHLGEFDFITIPKIFGWHAPSETILEMAVGFAELARVLDNGLIHIADEHILPELAYIAFRMGFRCFVNPGFNRNEAVSFKGMFNRSAGEVVMDDSRPIGIFEAVEWNGIPIGLLLVKRDQPLTKNPFHSLVSELEKGELHFRENDMKNNTIQTLMADIPLGRAGRRSLRREISRVLRNYKLPREEYPTWNILK